MIITVTLFRTKTLADNTHRSLRERESDQSNQKSHSSITENFYNCIFKYKESPPTPSSMVYLIFLDCV